MVDLAEAKELIKLARDSINAYFSKDALKISDELKKRFSDKRGCFVTLTIDGGLRGCIGYPEPVFPLYKAIADAAKSAAFSDPRFRPLTEDEFKDVSIEISVLTKPELIKADKAEDYPKKIKIGEDGLIIRGSYGAGLLLPQVFKEYNCDAKHALEMTCQKAGLSPDAWKDISNTIYKFQAEIFSEENGRIVEKKLY